MERKMKVLVVDDKSESIYMMETLLKGRGCEVISASNGMKALEKLRGEEFDMIIADILMPVMDGLRFCREVKGDEKLNHIPFVFYTATYTDEKDEELALKIGADRFIRKPVDPEEFIKIMHGVIGDAKKGLVKAKRPILVEEKEIFGLYSERLVKKLQNKMLDLERKITEHEQAKKALRESDKRYLTLLKTISEGWWLLNSGHKIIEVNQAICNMLGYSEKEMLGKTPFDFVDDENQKIFIEQTSKIPTKHQRSYEIILKKRNGEDLYAHFNESTIRDESGDMQDSFALIADITEKKQAEKERDRLAVAIEQTAESVFITARDGTIQYVNPAFERLTGYSRKDAIGQNPRILKSGKHDALFYKKMWDTITGGDAWHGRVINKKKDGTFYEADATISPVSDKSGKITSFVSIEHDVTHELEVEKHLIQVQKMEAIGTLAGGIAHDFNNILTAILGYAEMVRMKLPEGSKILSDIDQILKSGMRAKGLVQQILAFSRDQKLEQRPLQLGYIVKETLKLLRSTLPSDIEIKEDIAKDIGIINADPTQMQQVIMNLCTNAGHAMQKGGGLLSVSLVNVELDDIAAAHYIDTDTGSYLRLTVSDTGSGMTSDVIEHIFEPYFTTKEKGVGTGMGLSIVHGIVKNYNGGITVYSEPGKGSTFHIYLPRIGEAEEQPTVREKETPSAGHERILLIDDEPALAELGKQMLELFGYEVDVRMCSRDGLELFRSQSDRFDLVITDMTMPKMTGDKLAKKLVGIRPDIPIIICTGYSERISENKAKRIGVKALVMKPFVIKDLVNTVRKVIDGSIG
jgi:PAS domain S-box-containing protein